MPGKYLEGLSVGALVSHVVHLNSSNGGYLYIGDYIRFRVQGLGSLLEGGISRGVYRGSKGDTRSLDYSSCGP